MYTPPFDISQQAINLIASISAQIERYAIHLERNDGLQLRKANRIKTIHSSLAIEGNTLTETEVRDIIDGKQVIAPAREIQEVRNAIRTYEAYDSFNPHNVNDLLRAHKLLMEGLTEDAGRFRKGGVGVFGEKGLVHLAPPADRVPMLIDGLLGWLKSSGDHLLIRSCVFHYEFEIIHPFSDGNGRTGRLWQSHILGQLNPLFKHLPVENIVYANQQAYYNAIAASTKAGQSGPFIDFMLDKILTALQEHRSEGQDKLQDKLPDSALSVLKCILDDNSVTANKIAEQTGLKERQVRSHIAALKAAGAIRRVGSNKTGHWEIIV